MEFSRELLFFFSALGAFNGVLLSLYFFFLVKKRKVSHAFLGLLLLLLSIRIGKSVFLYFNPGLLELFVQIGLSACFLIGPALFLYIVSAKNEKHWIVRKWWVQLVPFLIGIVIVSYMYPYYDNLPLWKKYLIDGIYWQWFGYLLCAGYVIRSVFKSLVLRNVKLSANEVWQLSVFIGVLIVWVAYNTTVYTSYITGAISFTFMLYIYVLLLVFKRKNETTPAVIKEKYMDKKIGESEANSQLEKLQTLMINESLFRNANLKSSDVAKKIQLTTHQFSQLLNDNLGKSFPVFINEYKISAAKKMIEDNSQLTLESIGYECGFNSKSTFFTTFKKLEGTTPAKYRAQLKF